MKYSGFGRFIVYKSNSEFHKYELVHSEITQFGFTVPFKKKEVSLTGLTSVKEIGEVVQPHSWLEEYVHNCMPYELDNFIDGYDFKMEEGEFAEICGFLSVEDTSGWTDGGYEYDSQLSLEEPSFTVFKLEDLKESYFYNARAVAEWLEHKEGLAEGETTEDVYDRLIKEGYPKIDEEPSDEESVKFLF